MSQTAWIKGPVCGVDNCRSRLYRSSAGQMFCQYGHIMEGNIEYDNEDGESYTQTRRLNIQLTDGAFGTTASQSASQSASVVASTTTRLYGEKGRLQHLKCLQHIMRLVVPRVVSHLHGDLPKHELESYRRSLTATVKLLWVRCVKKCKTKPTVLDVYVMIYLAMRQLNQLPVFVDQYLAMLKHNRVPFFNATALVPAAMLSIAPVATLSLTSSTFVPLDDMFYKSLLSWCRTLELPHISAARADTFYPLVYKLFTELHLPDPPRLLCVFHELCSTRNYVLKAGGAQSFPEIQAIALALEVVRLYFFNSDEMPDPKMWIRAISDNTIACFDRAHHSMTVSEIMALSDGDVEKYCSWVYETLVPSRHKDPEVDLSTVERQLNRIFTYPETTETHLIDQASISVQATSIPLIKGKLSEKSRNEVERALFSVFSTRFGLTESTLTIAVKAWERDIFAKTFASRRKKTPTSDKLA